MHFGLGIVSGIFATDVEDRTFGKVEVWDLAAKRLSRNGISKTIHNPLSLRIRLKKPSLLRCTIAFYVGEQSHPR